MRILFSFIGGSGHFIPLIPVARAAAAAGHTVAVAGSGGMVPKIEAAGFTAFPTSERRSPGAAPQAQQEQPERMPVPPVDPEREERQLREGFAGRGAPRHAAAILELAREWKPDILVRDEVDFGTAIAAEVLGIPCATVIVLSAGGFLHPEVVAEPLHELRAEYGLPSDPQLAMLTRGLLLSPGPPSFRDPNFPLPDNTFSYRPTAAIPASAASRPPTVYFTLGTERNSIDLVSRVLDGLKEVAANAVVTVGDHIDPAEFEPMPERIRVERFIPQELLLPTCDLVISHGGSGTVMGTLAHGLPSVLLPMGADQPHNAQRCVDLGIARVLDPVSATPDEVRAAVSAVLADPGYRRAAERIQDEINALPELEQTIPLLERLR
jgi:UDP:flavonoid glycosyltransferase YjiC (YdhE family)